MGIVNAVIQTKKSNIMVDILGGRGKYGRGKIPTLEDIAIMRRFPGKHVQPNPKKMAKEYERIMSLANTLTKGLKNPKIYGSKTGGVKADWIKGRDFDPVALASLLANYFYESRLDPLAKQKGGPAKGIGQWEKLRFRDLLKFAQRPSFRRQGLTWKDYEVQELFIMEEMFRKKQNYNDVMNRIYATKNLNRAVDVAAGKAGRKKRGMFNPGRVNLKDRQQMANEMFNLVSMPEPKQYGFPEIPGDYTDIEDDKKQIENIKRTDPAQGEWKEVKDMIRKGKPKFIGYFEGLKNYIFGR